MTRNNFDSCPFCESKDLGLASTFTKRPDGETEFASLKEDEYRRKLLKCGCCAHFLSSHDIDLENLYEEDYASSTYGDEEGITKAYSKVMGLPHDQSDNSFRVERIIDFATHYFSSSQKLDVLDIGSGLCVFLAKIKMRTDWDCTAVEPDERYCHHAKNTIGVEVIPQDYRLVNLDRKFNLITLNKVLEHFLDPLEVLKKCASDLATGGLIYIELPDGESAAEDQIGFEREEFFIDHHHAFSMASMELFIKRSGLRSLTLERVREPSSKYTLRGFVSHKSKFHFAN
jgi:SAM-dependent methyltransferase